MDNMRKEAGKEAGIAVFFLKCIHRFIFFQLCKTYIHMGEI